MSSWIVGGVINKKSKLGDFSARDIRLEYVKFYS